MQHEPGEDNMRENVRSRLSFLGVLWLAFALRVYRLGVDSLWYDETVSALLARKSLTDMWAHTSRDIHPPLYYALLHVWRGVAGGSEYSLAFLSVWFGVVSVALVGYLGWRIFGRQVGLMAAFLMAINPFSIWYAQEVRMYAIGGFLLLAALKFTLDFLETGRIAALLGYVMAAALLLWTLYYSAFALLALNLILLPWFWLRRRRYLWRWLMGQAFILVLYSPWLPHALNQALNPPVPPWRQPLSLFALLTRIGVEGATALTLGQSVRPESWWWFGTLTLGIALLALKAPTHPRHKFNNPWIAMLLWGMLVGPVLLIILFSLLFTPLYHVRYLNLYSGTLPILVAAGFFALWRPIQRFRDGLFTRRFSVSALIAGLWFVLLLGASFISLRNYHVHRFDYEAADDLRGAVADIYKRMGPRDAILIDAGYLYPAFLNYWPGAVGWMGRLSAYPPPHHQIGAGPIVVLAGFVDGDANIGWGDPQSDFYAISREETETRLLQLFADHNTVWVLRGYDTVNDPQGIIRAWLEQHGQRMYERVFPGLTYVRVQAWRTAPVRHGLPVLPPTRPLSVQFNDGIGLIGFDVSPNPPQAGDPLRLTLYWQAHSSPTKSYKAFVHLLDEQWEKLAQDDVLPGYGAMPTNQWVPGAIVETNFVLFPPAESHGKAFRLITGFYDSQTGERLLLQTGEDYALLMQGMMP